MSLILESFFLWPGFFCSRAWVLLSLSLGSFVLGPWDWVLLSCGLGSFVVGPGVFCSGGLGSFVLGPGVFCSGAWVLLFWGLGSFVLWPRVFCPWVYVLLSRGLGLGSFVLVPGGMEWELHVGVGQAVCWVLLKGEGRPGSEARFHGRGCGTALLPRPIRTRKLWP